jgi:hypothetical protein
MYLFALYLTRAFIKRIIVYKTRTLEKTTNILCIPFRVKTFTKENDNGTNRKGRARTSLEETFSLSSKGVNDVTITIK